MAWCRKRGPTQPAWLSWALPGCSTIPCGFTIAQQDGVAVLRMSFGIREDRCAGGALFPVREGGNG